MFRHGFSVNDVLTIDSFESIVLASRKGLRQEGKGFMRRRNREAKVSSQ
jgi:hypothetical protein